MSLAIIIPAYKDHYFEKALQSLANQTNKNFTVYVGDDNSPNELFKICELFKDRMNLVYHHFDNNLGGEDLVAHWERCVSLMKDEEWLWIFSDDDLAEETCVECFYAAIAETNGFYDAYRFNVTAIDSNDNITNKTPASPTVEYACDLAYHILINQRGNSMPDHIFNTEAYIQKGGVVNFIQAQASDWATSIKFAGDKGLYTISGPRIRWRYSGQNVSSTAHKNNAKLIYGHLQFIDWVIKLPNIKCSEKNNVYKKRDLIKATKFNLDLVITSHYRGVPNSDLVNIAKIIGGIYNKSLLFGLLFCLKINYKVYKRNR
ncbi:glycosyltransferase family 2 protein [Mucilaginibacter calamicampi]|uniref:Glycosyltransferase family 2 protein n=1 Tax=Mucilaginibacter calamicampi TaxID=1302352 RepID=A0ABW2YWB7_9SPHI